MAMRVCNVLCSLVRYQCHEAGPPDEDELFEENIIDTNVIYRVEMEDDNALLVPSEDYWGQLPKIEMLKKNEALVFDCGSEVYLYHGVSVVPRVRKASLRLVQELIDEGYDYSSCNINPVFPTGTLR
ncbi:PREDICTED: supervillin-like [Priapulus caudatus]|uniref:Supervillin-like n=1 Tax=Priapulus caudatus TaxID=37621 RepID=A0ABM1ERD3_PRICU|nr:PREDICTED: supervillin-like [Priapulus caudatus]